MSRQPFGFGKPAAVRDLPKVDPTPIPEDDGEVIARADRAAADLGFVHRPASPAAAAPQPPAPVYAPAPRLQRKQKELEPRGQLTVRGTMRSLKRFIDYCDEQELSYGEAIDRLLDEVKFGK